MPLLQTTHDFLGDHGYLHAPGLVAVSGGPDSIALGHVLNRLRGQDQLPCLGIVHVNHCLRGAESAADEAFVRALPELWADADVRVHCTRVDVALRAQRERLNLEDAGRRARYGFFADVARQTGARWVASAHTADDQAETLLLRLLRGAGLAGLAGIPEARPLTENCTLLRPWLGIRKSQVRAYLDEHRLSWREDATNQSDRFLRNRVRNQLIPLLERDFQPALVPLLNRLSRQAREVQEYLGEQAETLRAKAEKPRAGDVLVFDIAALGRAPSLLVREMFRLVWQREQWPRVEMGLAEWGRLVSIIEGKTRAIDLPGGVHARLKGQVLQVKMERSNFNQ